MILQGVVKTWVSVAPVRIDHRRESKGAQSGGSGIIQERANNDFGKGGSSRKGESSDSGYILKGELIDVADRPTCKTKGGIKVDFLV